MSNAYIHSQISVKRYKGKIDDYYKLHDFIDCTKEIESTNKHRILHNLWGIKQIIIPIFGHTIKNSNGFDVNVKDLCEQDHVLHDYKNKFIPNLNDFVLAISDNSADKELIDAFYAENSKFLDSNKEIKNLLLSPLWITGKIKSLLITHNSWFIGFILPKIFPTIKIEIKDFNISPANLFNRMEFQDWMANGRNFPPSYKKKDKEINLPSLEEQQKHIPEITKGVIYYDGSNPNCNPLSDIIADGSNHPNLRSLPGKLFD